MLIIELGAFPRTHLNGSVVLDSCYASVSSLSAESPSAGGWGGMVDLAGGWDGSVELSIDEGKTFQVAACETCSIGNGRRVMGGDWYWNAVWANYTWVGGTAAEGTACAFPFTSDGVVYNE